LGVLVVCAPSGTLNNGAEIRVRYQDFLFIGLSLIIMKYSHFFLFLLFANCQSPKENQAKNVSSSDSILIVETDTVTYAIDSVAPLNSLTQNDTVKTFKTVFVKSYYGLKARQDTNNLSETPRMRPFCEELEVIEEYLNWYKVRTGYGKHTEVFYVLKEDTSEESPISTNLFFPQYELSIKSFENELGDTSRVSPFINDQTGELMGFNVKTDTIYLSEGLGMYVTNNRFLIIPKDKNDRFKITYAFEQEIYEVFDDRISKRPEGSYKWIRWKEMTSYVQLKDSLNYFFRMPGWSKAQDNDINALKRKYSLKDTSIVIPGEYDTVVSFTRKGKLFSINTNSIILRIDRIARGKIKDRKYIVVWYSYGC
jgi:hypothetical protein